MQCPKCSSENVNVQIVNELRLKTKHHGIIWWMLVGWWWVPFAWFFLTIPMLILALLGYRKQKIVNIKKSMAVCQNCGNSWEVRK